MSVTKASSARIGVVGLAGLELPSDENSGVLLGPDNKDPRGPNERAPSSQSTALQSGG